MMQCENYTCISNITYKKTDFQILSSENGFIKEQLIFLNLKLKNLYFSDKLDYGKIRICVSSLT